MATSAAAPMPDEVLVARVAQYRDKLAFSVLYDRHAPAVYAMAVHMLGVGDAPEAVQIAFLKLWTEARQFDPARGTFAAWFMTVARNSARTLAARRSLEQRATSVDELDAALARVPSQDNTEDQAERNLAANEVRNALVGLPDEQRKALLLSYFGGLSHGQIAGVLNLPLGTVKKRISLGLQKLANRLQGGTVRPQRSAEPAPEKRAQVSPASEEA